MYAEEPPQLTDEEWRCFDGKLMYTPQETIEYQSIPTMSTSIRVLLS